jgi:hypothetical protein
VSIGGSVAVKELTVCVTLIEDVVPAVILASC